MKLAAPLLMGFALTCIAAAPATSQDIQSSHTQSSRSHALSDQLQAFEFTREFDLDVIAISQDDLPDDAGVYADLRARFSFEHITSSQTRWGARIALAALSSDGERAVSNPHACGQNCPDGVGAITGLSALAGVDPADNRAGVELAELYLKRPYYELRLGRIETASGLQTDRPARALRLAGGESDLIGAGLTRTRGSLAYGGWGASITSQRLVGVALSASYSFENDPCTLRACRFSAPQADIGALEHIWALGLSYEAGRQTRWRAELAAQSGQHTPSEHTPHVTGLSDPWVLRGAVHRRSQDWTLSISGLVSNDGLERGEYSAVSAGLAYETGDWLWSGELGWGQSDAFEAEGYELVLAGSRFVSDYVLLSAGIELGDAYGESQLALISEIGLRF